MTTSFVNPILTNYKNINHNDFPSSNPNSHKRLCSPYSFHCFWHIFIRIFNFKEMKPSKSKVGEKGKGELIAYGWYECKKCKAQYQKYHKCNLTK